MAIEEYIQKVIPFVKGKFGGECSHSYGKSHRIFGFCITGDHEVSRLYAECEVCGRVIEITEIESILKKE